MSVRFEQYTYEKLLTAALARVSDSLDKREGSIIYDALAPACYVLAEHYLELGNIDNITYAQTSVGEDLTLRCAERSVVREAATQAIRLGMFNLQPPLGSRFRIQDATYVVVEALPGFESKLQCEQTGVLGNQYSGALLPIDYINNLTIANLTDILIPGQDEESDEELRLRYFEGLSSQSYGGNVADYKAKTKALPGIGGVKVTPVWNGGGTVKLVIIDSTFAKPSTILVNATQTAIDPIPNGGLGLGIAPIGHSVTVAGVTDVTCNLAFYVTLTGGIVWADVQAAIISALQAHMLSLRQAWETESALVVRISQIESAVLTVVGVLDVTGTTINAIASNLVLSATQIPILGTVTRR